MFEEARAEYEIISRSLPGRTEGRLARFRSGLCALELHRRESDPEVRQLALEEATQTFAAGDEGDSCLMSLGQALVADRRGDTAGMHDALEAALQGSPGDPQLAIVHEWLLGRLHRLSLDERRAAAELLLLGIRNSFSGWGRRSVQELVRKARQSWETPSFLTGRSRLREADPVSHFDALLFFSFWAGRSESIVRSVRELEERKALRPHNFSDAFFALVELGESEAAVTLNSEIESRHRSRSDDQRWQPFLACCRSTEAALEGAFADSLEILQSSRFDKADPLFRPFNSARLTLARAAWSTNKELSRRALRSQGRRDSFSP